VDHAHQRTELVELSRRAAATGLSIGTAGNLSIRVDDGVLITPSGRDVEHTEPLDICLVDFDGKQITGELRPSSEVPMHLAVYRTTDAAAVVHTHSPYATALSLTMTELPSVHYTINGLGGPVRVAPYATFGTPQLAGHIAVALKDRQAAILQNHGTIAIGASLRRAFDRAVLLEWLCTLYWRALQAGTPKILSEAELADVAKQSAHLHYGSQR